MNAGLMIDVPDAGGLICGFALRRGGPPEALRTPPGEGVGPVWLHFNLVDGRARQWIGDCEAIPRGARELLLDEDPHVRLTTVAPGVAGVLGDLHYDFSIDDPEGFGVFRLYVDEERLITGRSHALSATNRLRRDMAGGMEVGGTAGALWHLLNDLADNFDAVVSRLAESVDEMEDLVLRGRTHDEPGELGRIRRLLARLRRHIGADRNALAAALPRWPGWCAEEDGAQLRAVTQRLEALGQDVELVQERARLLQEEIAGRIGQVTNRNLYVLSVVTTVFLPITLITGIFGMNVAGLPGLENPRGFFWVMAGIGAVGAGVLGVLRWKRFM